MADKHARQVWAGEGHKRPHEEDRRKIGTRVLSPRACFLLQRAEHDISIKDGPIVLGEQGVEHC